MTAATTKPAARRRIRRSLRPVPEEGLEPPTRCLYRSRSAVELPGQTRKRRRWDSNPRQGITLYATSNGVPEAAGSSGNRGKKNLRPPVPHLNRITDEGRQT